MGQKAAWMNRIGIGGIIVSSIYLLTFSSAPAEADLPRASVDVNQGRKHLEQGDFAAARVFFENFLKSGRFSPAGEYEALWSLGILAWTDDEMDESRKYLSRASDIALPNGWTKRVSECTSAERILDFYLQGIEARNKGATEKAESLFRNAAELAESIRSPGHLLKALRGWSALYLGEPSREIFKTINERALEAARALHHREEIRRSLQNLGGHHLAKHEYSLALSRYFEALNRAGTPGDDRNRFICLNAVATAYTALGDYSRAIEYGSEAHRIARLNRSPLVAGTILGNLGDTVRRVFIESGNPEAARRALDVYGEALIELAKTTGTEFSRNVMRAGIGSILVDLGRPREALAELRAAAETAASQSNPVLSVALAVDLGRAFWEMGDPTRAEVEFIRALTASKQTHFPVPPAKALLGLARCAEKKGDLAGALSHGRKALDIVEKIGQGIGEDLHRTGYAGEWAEIYETVLDLCFRMAEKGPAGAFTREMFSTIEKAKSGIPIRADAAGRMKLDSKIAEQPDRDLESLKAKRDSALKTLASKTLNPTERTKVEFTLRQIEDMMAVAAGKKAPEKDHEDGPVSVETIQEELLDDRTALLEFWLGRERSFGLVLTKGNFGIVELPAARLIEGSLTAYLGFLANPDIPAAKGFAAGERLYGELFAPLADALPTATDRLFVVPDGILNALPFEALRIPSQGVRESRYLLDRFTVSYAPSARALLQAVKRRKSGVDAAGLLAVGASKYPRPPRKDNRNTASLSQIMASVYADMGVALRALPYARKEIALVAGHFPKKSTRLLLGNAATETAFKASVAGDHGIVHIASHALSDEVDPMRSAIVFTPETSGDKDGFFQLREMEGIRFSADLVVLSGCRTAGGKRWGHSGVIGLPRAMFRMGARAVVSSLWKAEDRAAAGLMDAFYGALSGSGDAPSALRSAKIAMLASEYSHPAYWAGFVLTGAR